VAAGQLDLLAMGEESSLALGGSPTTARVGAALSVVVLAGSATAATGPIAFVGFAIPHIVRRVVGPSVATMILPSALLGGCAALAGATGAQVGRFALAPAAVRGLAGNKDAGKEAADAAKAVQHDIGWVDILAGTDDFREFIFEVAAQVFFA